MALLIDAEWCRKHNACYRLDQLLALFDRPMTILEVLTRHDGKWDDVPAKDRIWAFAQKGAVPDHIMREWQARLVERAMSRIQNPDPRSVAVVNALGTNTLTEEIKRAARSACAEAEGAADDAAYAAAKCGSERAAAERATQLADAIELLRKDGGK